jgi:hypothetical protein
VLASQVPSKVAGTSVVAPAAAVVAVVAGTFSVTAPSRVRRAGASSWRTLMYVHVPPRARRRAARGRAMIHFVRRGTAVAFR